jgi:hypothetical protein
MLTVGGSEAFMAKPILLLASISAVAIAAGAVAVLWPPAPQPPKASAASPLREPGGAPEDVALAVNNPDEYAWRMFFFINRQAQPGAAGVAEPKGSIRRYGADSPVVWETWALVSGQAKTQVGSEVYRPGGVDPVDWAALARTPWPAKLLSASLSQKAGPPSKEIRINRPGYDFIRSGGLYRQDGLQRLYTQAVAQRRPDLIQFPSAAKEVKAQWEDLGASPSAAKLARYHWRLIGGRYWVLTGLHIATKDLPNWFWADFEHVDDPILKGEPSIDATTRTDHGSAAPAKGSVEGERRELTGTKWAYYRLRGTQTGFTDARGDPTHVSNGAIEAGFEHSSCMTCHARATIRFTGGQLTHLGRDPVHSDDGGRPPMIVDRANADLGAPSPTLFGKDGLTYVQTDFVWSIPSRAQPSGR